MLLYDGVAPITVIGFQLTNSPGIEATRCWNTLAALTLIDGQIGIKRQAPSPLTTSALCSSARICMCAMCM